MRERKLFRWGSSGLCLLLAAVVSGAQLAAAQALDPKKALTQYVMDRWQQEQGLPQNTVHSVLQSRDGYLWIGTYQGIARFDGVNFTIFNMANTPELKSNGIWSIAEGRDGALWFGTNGGGLVRMHQGRFAVYGPEQGLSALIVRSVMRDNQDALWLAYASGLSRMTEAPAKGGRPPRLTLAHVKGLERYGVLAIAQDRSGVIWAGCREGLFRVSQTDSQWVASRHAGMMGRSVYALFSDPDGSLWVGTEDGLYRLLQGEFTRLGTQQGLSDDRIAKIYKDRSGTLWAITVSGDLNRLVDGKFSHLSIRDDFQDNRIFSVLEDREGSLWFGTSRSGLHRLKESKITSFGRPEGMTAEVTYAIAQAPDGSMLLGTNGGGVNVIRDGVFQRSWTAQSAGLSSNYTRSLAVDARGGVWVASYGYGLDYVVGGRKVATLSRKTGLLDEFVRVVEMVPDGSLWVGTRRGINRVDAGRIIAAYGPEQGLTVPSILCIEVGGTDKVFAGTDGGGLAQLKAGRFTTLTTADGLPSEVVLALLWDRRDQVLWIGTNNGLALMRNGKITSYVARDRSMPESVLQLLDDETGNLWMGSTNGLYCVSKASLYAYADGRLAQLDVKHYGRSDGLRSIECTPNGHPSSFRSADGRLWFPTSRGVIVVDPWQVPLNRLPPPVRIEGVQIGETLRPADSTFVVEPGTPRFEMHYSALSFMVPEKVRFQYRMIGYDENWVEAGTRRIAYYTALPAGTYTFHVRACNNDGVWNETGAMLRVEVQPFFYQTWWFITLAGIALVGIGLGLYGLRVRVLQRQNQVLEAMVDARTAEITEQSEQLKRQTQAMTLSNTNLNVLAEIGKEITSTLNANEVFALLERSMQRLMEFDIFTVHEYRPEHHELFRSYAVESGHLQPVSAKSIDDTSSLAVYCVKNRKAIHLRDYDNEYKAFITTPKQYSREKMRSVMVAPMMIKEKILGCVGVQSARIGAFHEWQFEMLQTLASYGAVALDNAKAYDTISRVNQEIGRQNSRLAKALDELKAAQDQLVFSEKMAALGQLVASVAHEINTPISAITTTTRNTDRVLPELMMHLPEMLKRLSGDEQRQLDWLVGRAAAAPEYATTKAERQARHALRDELDQLGIDKAESLASRLAQLRVPSGLTDVAPLLRRPDALELLQLAGQLAVLQQNNELVRKAAEKTTKIVSALKAYAHASHIEERSAVSLQDSIESILTLYANQLKQGIELVKDFAPIPPVPVFPDDIEQVWSNIIHNAILAMRGGGRLEISLAQQNGHALVRFIDTGVGIAPEVLPRIFDPFFTTRPKGEGSGLGLDIVRRIIQKHGGSIEVDSIPGRTAFEIRLPYQA